jgi:hypothetical protein
VSDARHVLSALRDALARERQAIRAFDAAAVADVAAEKERLAAELAALGAPALAGAREDVARLRAELRHNGLLLVHARAIAREAVDIAAAEGGIVRARL